MELLHGLAAGGEHAGVLAAQEEARLQAEAATWVKEGVAPTEMEEENLPTLDFAAFLRDEPGALEALATEVRAACTSTGFFFIANHSVEAAVMARAFAKSKEFHGLPTGTKTLLSEDRHTGMGYLELGHRKLPRRADGNNNAAYLIKKGKVVADGKVRAIGLDDNPWPVSCPRSPQQPRICSRTRMGYSEPPPWGFGAPHCCSFGVLLSIYADTRYIDAVIVSKAARSRSRRRSSSSKSGSTARSGCGGAWLSRRNIELRCCTGSVCAEAGASVCGGARVGPDLL